MTKSPLSINTIKAPISVSITTSESFNGESDYHNGECELMDNHDGRKMISVGYDGGCGSSYLDAWQTLKWLKQELESND